LWCKGKHFTETGVRASVADTYKNLELSYLLDFYGDVLTQKQRDVMEQYYNNDLSLSEIAENFSITRQGVRDSIKRGEAVLLDLEAKVGFAARYRAMQSGLSLLKTLADSLPEETAETQDKILAIITELAEA
jgi:predicted DNA-binding protein YlxM (UPF0122 family)